MQTWSLWLWIPHLTADRRAYAGTSLTVTWTTGTAFSPPKKDPGLLPLGAGKSPGVGGPAAGT